MHEIENESKALIEQLAWARRLATAMVADAGLAEDMVQDAWVQFLTRPPRSTGSTGSWKAWFTTVMRNLARQRWRRDRRREDLELAQASDESSEATAELVARTQAQQVLVETVLGLEQPYRDIVLLRFFEELESPAIAERLGMPASSVRTRLQRGLALVRAQLEDRHRTGAQHWLSAVLPLLQRPPGLAVPVSPDAQVPRSPAARVGNAASSSAPAGWALTAALSVSTLAVVALVTRSAGEPVTPSLERVAGASASDARLQGLPTERPGARTPHPELTAASPVSTSSTRPSDPRSAPVAIPEPEPETVVQVTIDGAPASQGVVLLSPAGSWIDADLALDGGAGAGSDDVLARPIDPGGRAVFENVTPERGAIGLAPYPGAAVIQRSFRKRPVGRPDAGEALLLELGSARIEGRVWNHAGEPAADVTVLLGIQIGNDYGALRSRSRSDAQGRFVFDRLPAASFMLHVEEPGRVEELRTHGELVEGEVRELQLGRPSGRVHWSGRLLDVAGNALAFEPWERHGLVFASVDDGSARSYFPADLTPDGSYAVELVPGEYAIRRNSGTGSSPQLVAARVRVESDEQRDLVLAGARVVGTAQIAERATPFDPARDGPLVLELRREDSSGATTRYLTSAGAQGRYSFAGLQPGRWILASDRLAEAAPVVVLLGSDDRERVVDVLVR